MPVIPKIRLLMLVVLTSQVKEEIFKFGSLLSKKTHTIMLKKLGKIFLMHLLLHPNQEQLSQMVKEKLIKEYKKVLLIMLMLMEAAG
jgi:hypothetical protein